MAKSAYFNIWNPLIDSLNYYRCGNYRTFDFCFRRVLNIQKVQIDKALYPKLRRRYFNAARVLGFLEVDFTSSIGRWSLNPPMLVNSSRGYILIAPPQVKALHPQLFREEPTHDIDIYCEEEDLRKFCSVSLGRLERVTDDLIRDFQRQGITVVKKVAETILPKLPPLPLVRDLCLEQLSGIPLEIAQEAEQFAFDKCEWIKPDPENVLDLALLRREDELGRREYLVRYFRKEEGVVCCRIWGKEWSFLIGASLLEKSLGLTYDESTAEFSIPLGVQLPTLVERLLIYSSMELPDFVERRFIYRNVSIKVARRISNIYPCLL